MSTHLLTSKLTNILLAAHLFVLFSITQTNSETRQGVPMRTVAEWVEQKNMNRPGGDIERIEMESGQKDQCAQECKDNPFCRAYTWVKKDVQGPKPVCWLKGEVPKAVSSDCCVSGALNVNRKFIGTFEPSTDLPGGDYLHGFLPKADPAICKQACARDGDCQAYTYVKPGIQGTQAICYLKESVSSRALKKDCCVSGIKETALVIFDDLPNTDLPGQNYSDFAVPTGGSSVCLQACRVDPDCQAYTYVKSTSTTPEGRCWLKTGVPLRRAATCCGSGIKRPGGEAMGNTMLAFDLPGSDYQWFYPEASDESRQHTICKAACGADSQCRAFTHVKPGYQGKAPVCYLKDNIPVQSVNRNTSSGSKDASRIGIPVSGPGAAPILYFTQNDPARQFAGLPFPADMPDVRYPSEFKNCSRGDADTIRRAWALAHHHMWRAQQVMQHVNRRDRERNELWNYGFIDRMKASDGSYNNWAPRGWFGAYEARRFRLARRAIDKVWNERFRGMSFEVQCRGVSSDGAHPCETAKDPFPANHIVLGKINFCRSFFDANRSDRTNAQTVIHEVFHWLQIPESAYWVSDSHDFWRSCTRYVAAKKVYHDDAAFIALNRGCRDWNFNRTVLTNDNYAWFATQVGTRIYGGQMRSFPAEDFR
ncbi:MAG: PAN domain-containing protein [Nitrospirales bacterium]|nr:PAN domain-containing protein [Nitrospirales bacterium]